jgi:hypothetical protein
VGTAACGCLAGQNPAVHVWDRVFDSVIERSSIALYREAAEVTASRNFLTEISELKSLNCCNVVALKLLNY